MVRIVLIVVGLTLLGGVGCRSIRPDSPSRGLEVNTSGVSFSSSNGFRYVVISDYQSNRVRLDVRYPVGNRDDPLGKKGLAHFVEHLLYTYTLEREGKETSLWSEFGRLSSYFNASTAGDYMHFESTGSAEVLEELIALEAERAKGGCHLIPQGVLEREREVVINELRQRNEGIGDIIRELHKSIYPEGHPYREVSTAESMRAISLSDVCIFLQGKFRKGVANVVITGAVTEEQAKRLLVKHFGKVPKRISRVNEGADLEEYRWDTTNIEQVKSDVQAPYLLLMWKLPQPSFVAAEAAAQKGAELASIVEQKLEKLKEVKESKGIESTFGFQFGPADARVQIVAIEFDEETLKSKGRTVDDLASYIRQQLRNLLEPVKLGKLKRIVDWIGAYESMEGKGNITAHGLQYQNDANPLITAMKYYSEGFPKEIVENTKLFSGLEMKSVLFLPSDTATFAEELDDVARTFEHAARDGVEVDGSLADSPYPLGKDVGRIFDVVEKRSAAGLRVLFWPYGSLPIVHARLVVRGGYGQDAFGSRTLFRRVMDYNIVTGGTVMRTDDRLSPYFDSTIRRVLRAMEGYGSRRKPALKEFEHSDESRFDEDMQASLFGEKHPYGMKTPEKHNSVYRGESSRWRNKYERPENSTLILTGSFDEKLAMEWIDYETINVKEGVPKPTAVPPFNPIRAAKWVRGVSEGKKGTVDVDIRFQGRSEIRGDYAARLVLAGILSSRLSSLRSKNAISYGFSAGYSPELGKGTWWIRGAVDAQRAGEAGALIQKLLNNLRSEGTEGFRHEFVLARKKIAEELILGAANAGEVANRLAFIVRFELPIHFFDDLVRRVANLKLEDIEKLIQKELGPNQQVFGAFGNKDAVEALLKSAKQTHLESAKKAE